MEYHTLVNINFSKTTAFIFSNTKQNEIYKRTEPRQGGDTENESNVAQCNCPIPPVSFTLLKPYQDLTQKEQQLLRKTQKTRNLDVAATARYGEAITTLKKEEKTL
ncbi:hypothetical protein E2C01_038209 [Portunus trituberculatus]|uniref:Uncharacterized protein n=1 Tax=Portunus trituberculatus TaxID=210409 RepID=A0A5B7FG80_PORTR|nr:hypothetical protein [Portunus trituberculatus]